MVSETSRVLQKGRSETDQKVIADFGLRNADWVLPIKFQIPSTKLQTNLKFQYSMTKTKNRFGISNFGSAFGGLFVWDL